MFLFARKALDTNAPINVTENIENVQLKMKQKLVNSFSSLLLVFLGKYIVFPLF